MASTRTRDGRQVGFSLIELLIIIVVLGVILGITTTALLNAREKARQGATLADMRSISSAIERYAVDNGLPPASTGNFRDLERLLEPFQSSVVPVEDHWGNLYSYLSQAEDYTLQSFGKDGIDGPDITPATRSDFDRDIVLVNGTFVASPQP